MSCEKPSISSQGEGRDASNSTGAGHHRRSHGALPSMFGHRCLVLRLASGFWLGLLKDDENRNVVRMISLMLVFISPIAYTSLECVLHVRSILKFYLTVCRMVFLVLANARPDPSLSGSFGMSILLSAVGEVKRTEKKRRYAQGKWNELKSKHVLFNAAAHCCLSRLQMEKN